MQDELADFTRETFSHDGVSRPVYRMGKGRGVVLLHEVPGITPEAARLARLLAEAGHSVLMPSLFGTPGKPFGATYVATALARVCIAGEFATLASARSGPIVDWLRALCRAAPAELVQIRDRSRREGVPLLGLRFTGDPICPAARFQRLRAELGERFEAIEI